MCVGSYKIKRRRKLYDDQQSISWNGDTNKNKYIRNKYKCMGYGILVGFQSIERMTDTHSKRDRESAKKTTTLTEHISNRAISNHTKIVFKIFNDKTRRSAMYVLVSYCGRCYCCCCCCLCVCCFFLSLFFFLFCSFVRSTIVPNTRICISPTCTYVRTLQRHVWMRCMTKSAKKNILKKITDQQ